MCGILGAVETVGDGRHRAGLHQWVEAAIGGLRHRGPDAEGTVHGDRVHLGSRRLRIHDTSGHADQPFETADGRHVIIFNGAIFNHRDLRDDLRRRGHRFRTDCDTEVLLQALVEWGADVLPRLDGMFAFAWHDRRRGRVLIGRDKLGIKPLYYVRHGEFLLFSSEIKPMLRHPMVPRALNRAAVPEFLAFQFVMPPRTLFRDILVLPPGHCLWFDPGLTEPLRLDAYWQITDGLCDDRSAPSVEEALVDSVRRVWDADRTVGIQLSGGVDSSLVTAISATALGRTDPRTYSVIFDDSRSRYYLPRSEEAYINRVVDQYNTQSHLYLFDQDAVRPALAEAIWWHEAPLHGPSTCLYMLFARAIADQVTVLLTGEGADDIFLGYFADWQFDAVSRSLFKMFVREPTLARLVGADGVASARAQREALAASPRLAAMTPRQRASALTIETVLHGLLARHDRMFMAASIEGRPPFCTDAMVRARFALDDDRVHDGRDGKVVLKDYCARFFGHDFAYRKKIGFSVPFGDWCADPGYWRGYVDRLDHDWVGSLMDTAPLVAHQALPEGADKWSQQNLNMIFAVTQLQLFSDIFFRATSPDTPAAWQAVVPRGA